MSIQRTFKTREKIIAATIRRFEHADIEHLTMIEIAQEAGVSRATIYRLFKNWETLLEAALTHRFIEVCEDSQLQFKFYQSLREALIEQPIYGLRQLRRDRFLSKIVAEMDNLGIGDLILIGNLQIHELFHALWASTFAKARVTGELTSPLSNERLIEGVRCVSGYLTMRHDLDEEGQRKHLRDFLIPQIFGSI